LHVSTPTKPIAGLAVARVGADVARIDADVARIEADVARIEADVVLHRAVRESTALGRDGRGQSWTEVRRMALQTIWTDIARVARLAPTPHNTQPFRLRPTGDDVAEILLVSERLLLSVASKSEGRRIEMFAGHVASEGVVVRWVSEYGLDGATVGVEGGVKSGGGVQHEGGATSDAGLFVGGELAERGVLDEEGAAECGEGGVGQVDDDDLRRDEEPAKLLDGHRFRGGAAGLVLGVCANTSRKSFSSRRASSRSAATARSSSARFMRTR